MTAEPIAWAQVPEIKNLPPWLKMRQATSVSGFSYSTIQRRVREGTLKAYRPTGSNEIRICRDSLIRMMTGSTEPE